MSEKDKKMNVAKKVNDGVMELSDDLLESAAGGGVRRKRWGYCNYTWIAQDDNNQKHYVVFNTQEEAQAYAAKMGWTTKVSE